MLALDVLNEQKAFELGDKTKKYIDAVKINWPSVMSCGLIIAQKLEEKYDRGTGTKIIGDCKGKSVILVEDVATSGGSLVAAVKEIHANGGICSHCIVVIHRQEGASKLCLDNEIFLLPVLLKSDFIHE